MLSTAITWVQTANGRSGETFAATEAWLLAERHQLILWVPVAFGLGASAYFSLPTPMHWWAAIGAGLTLAMMGTACSGLIARSLIIGGLLIAAGVGGSWLRSESVAAPRLERPRFDRTFEATVLGIERLVARDRTRLLLQPDDATLPPRLRISLRTAPPEGLAIGARIALRATLQPPPAPSVPGGYDFGRRAWFDGVGAVGYALGPVRLTAAAPPARVFGGLDTLRTHLTTRLREGVGGTSGGVAAALVTGDQGGVPDAVVQDWRDSGLAHLLSISGLHIATVVGGVMWIVRRALTLSPWVALRWPVKTIAAGAAALAGITYTLLAGAEVPTVRSCIATLIVLVGLSIGRQAISLRLVAVAALLILVVRPEALLSPSFQLSFAAVTALVAFYQSKLGKRLLEPRRDLGLVLRAGRAGAALLVTGLVAEAALAPIALHHFGRSGVYGVVANLIAIPVTSFVVMPAAVAAVLLDPLGWAAPAHAVLRFGLDHLNMLAHQVAGWPGAILRMPIMFGRGFSLFVAGGLWLCLWQGRVRLLGLLPLLFAIVAMMAARPADLLIGPDGRHAGIRASSGTLALLRPRAGRFISDMWGDAVAADRTAPLDMHGGHCSRDVCIVLFRRGGRTWRLLATRSRGLIEHDRLMPACRAADIVVSDRRLPSWCAPRWLKFDRRALERSGAVAIWLSPVRVITVAQTQGEHPWAMMQRSDN